MNTNLTIYLMAAEAEQPLLLRQLEHARRAVEAESSTPPRAGILRAWGRWLGAGIARPQRRPIGARTAAAAHTAAVVRAVGEAALPPS